MARKRYRDWSPFQSYLFPPSPREWLPDDHLVFFIMEVLSDLDLSPIEQLIHDKDPRGERPYDPKMMLALLMYGYCTGTVSSRKLERATYEDVATRVVVGDQHPHFTTINEFRRVHRDAFTALFLGVLLLCQRAGMVQLGHVAVDGTKVKANASKHKAMSYKRLTEEEKRLVEQIDALLDHADAVDEEEDARYGVGKRQWELPDELKRREGRLEKIRELRAQMEAEAKQRRAADLREQAAGMRETAQTHPDESMQRRLRTKANQAEEQASLFAPPEDDDDDDDTPPTALPERRIGSTAEGKPKPKTQRNFTDPDSHIMKKGQDGYEQAYNCQGAVDSAHQIIVSADVTNQPPDNHNLLPMTHQIRANLGEYPDNMTADNGYWNPTADDEAAALGVNALIATGRRKHGEAEPPRSTGPPPDGLDAKGWMNWKLNDEKNREFYRKRKAVVEPVWGQMKQCMGFDRFSFRGLRAVRMEWQLACACHNLLKLFRFTCAHAAT